MKDFFYKYEEGKKHFISDFEISLPYCVHNLRWVWGRKREECHLCLIIALRIDLFLSRHLYILSSLLSFCFLSQFLWPPFQNPHTCCATSCVKAVRHAEFGKTSVRLSPSERGRSIERWTTLPSLSRCKERPYKEAKRQEELATLSIKLTQKAMK